MSPKHNQRPALRTAPTAEVMAARQAEAERKVREAMNPAERLAALEDWTAQPAEPPAAAPVVAAPVPAPAPEPPAAVLAPAVVEPAAKPAEPAPVQDDQRASIEPAQAQGAGEGAAPATTLVVTAVPSRSKVTKPPTVAAPKPAPVQAAAPAAPLKPWETVPEGKTHPYHIVMSEELFQKIDFIWKRSGTYKSAKDFILQNLDAAADGHLREMGELP